MRCFASWQDGSCEQWDFFGAPTVQDRMKHPFQDNDTDEFDTDESTDTSMVTGLATRAKHRVEHVAHASGEELHQAQAQVAHEREPRWRVLRRGRVLLAAYVVVVLIVLMLALAAHVMSVLPGDLPFTRELQETTFPGVAGLMAFISYIGTPTLSGVLLFIACAVLLAVRMPLEACFLLLSLVADALGGLLKIVVGRHRPTTNLVHVVQIIKQPSFPSGHTLHYTVFYGFLIFVIATNYRRSWRRDTMIVLFAIPIALVGLSRVYLGEHWLSDVVGGYLVGALCLVALIACYLWTRERVVVTSQPPFVRWRSMLAP